MAKQKAVQEIIHICKDMDVLREYLLSKESEAVDTLCRSERVAKYNRLLRIEEEIEGIKGF